MNDATLWAMIREFWLDIENCGDYELLDKLKELAEPYKPIEIPDEKLGDMGWVKFADGSEILWNWDEGDFKVVDGRRFTYPYNVSDPLFWDIEG